jgi:hypothetical protein
VPILLLAFICGKQNSIRSLFLVDGVKFPITKGNTLINRRIELIGTLTEDSIVVADLLLFVLTAYLLTQIDIFDLEQIHWNVVVDGFRANLTLK